MQYKLSHLPLLKIVLPLIAGILFFNYTNISFPVLLIATGVLFMVFLVSHFSIETQFLKKLNAVIGIAFVFIIGGLMISNKKFSHQQNHFSLYNATFAKGIISKPIEEKEKTYKTFIAVQHIIDSTEIEKTANGNLLVYIQKDSTLANLEVGDVVLLQQKSQSVASPKNIGEFDYKNFLQHKSVFQQQYITKNEITVLQKHKSLWVKRFSNSISLICAGCPEKIYSKTRKLCACRRHFARPSCRY
jgi:hypothetical protein